MESRELSQIVSDTMNRIWSSWGEKGVVSLLKWEIFRLLLYTESVFDRNGATLIPKDK